MEAKKKTRTGISKIAHGSLITLIFVLGKLVSRKLKIFNFFETSFPRTKIRVIRLPCAIFDIPVLVFFLASIQKHTIETSVFVFLFAKHAFPLENLFRKLCSRNKFGKFVF